MFGSLFSPLIAFNVLLLASPLVSAENDTKRSPSIILLIPDGMGPALGTLTREFKRVLTNSSEQFIRMAYDEDHVGSLQTKSANNLVTDSAAAGTAFASGVSTNNSFIGYDADYKVLPNVLEGAKALGYRTGLVTTTRVTHATPAAFSSHVYFRDNEALIAQQQLGEYVLGRQVDLLWGGGRGFFLPESDDDSSREDSRDLIAEAKSNGYSVILDRSEFDDYTSDVGKTKRNRFARSDSLHHLPSLGLFTRSHMSYEIDRDPAIEPSVSEMAVGALNALESTATPFFLMVEAGRIDHSAHANDPAATAWEVLAYEEMYASLSAWVQQQPRPEDYVILAMADHDTGGSVLPGNWKPSALLKTKDSVEALATWIRPRIANQTFEQVRTFTQDVVVADRLGIPALTEANLDKMARIIQNGTGVSAILAQAANNASGIVWGTGGHSEVDVSLYFPSKKHEDLLPEIAGEHTNTWLGKWVAQHLGADLPAIKAKLESQADLGGVLPDEVPSE